MPQDCKSEALGLYQCAHGDLHLRVQRVTLSLTPQEFRELATFVNEASLRLAQRREEAAEEREVLH